MAEKIIKSITKLPNNISLGGNIYMRKSKLIILTTLTLLSLSACSKKQTEPTEPSSLEAIAPETTEAETTDKLDDGGTLTVPTIGVTEGEINPDGEVGTIGITETLEDASYIGVNSDGDLLVTFNLPKLSSGHEYSEAEAIALDNLAYYWSENNVSEDALRERLADSIYDGLSDADKEEIVTKISTDNPHTNPEPETTEAATEQSEESTQAVDTGSSLFRDNDGTKEITSSGANVNLQFN